MKFTGSELRRAMLEVAREEWLSVVESNKNQDRITQYWDDCGWGNWLRHQTKTDGYVRRKGSGVDWCGIFLAWCGLNVGKKLVENMCVDVRMHPSIPLYILPSTRRIDDRSRWSRTPFEPLQPVPPTGIKDIKPGDIITLKTSGNYAAGGDHYAIIDEVMSVSDSVKTIEGNAVGILGDDVTRDHGVVVRFRAANMIRRVWRFESHHFQNNIGCVETPCSIREVL